jgi:hypothetical protein
MDMPLPTGRTAALIGAATANEALNAELDLPAPFPASLRKTSGNLSAISGLAPNSEPLLLAAEMPHPEGRSVPSSHAKKRE